MRQKSKAYFYQVTVLAFGDTVLLRGVTTRNAMRYAGVLEIVVLATPIQLDSFDFGV
jgi:hypothetical protein